MNDYLLSFALLLEVLVLLWLGKMAASLAFRRRLQIELTTNDNVAVAVFFCGFVLAVLIALSGLLVGPGHGDLAADLTGIALHGSLAIAALLLSTLLWPLLYKIRVFKEIFEQKNVADGVVAAAMLVAAGIIYRGSLQGEGGAIQHVLAFFGLGQLCLFVMSLVYHFITPYDVHREISENKNLAAALGFAGAIVAFGIVLGNAAQGNFLGWDHSLKEFGKMAAPVVLIYPIRMLVVNGLLLGFRHLNKEITVDKNVGAGLIEGVTYVGLALVVIELLSW